jgi:hypothetical protein
MIQQKYNDYIHIYTSIVLYFSTVNLLFQSNITFNCNDMNVNTLSFSGLILRNVITVGVRLNFDD